MTDPRAPYPSSPNETSSVRLPWRVGLACALVLTTLFSAQSYLSQGVVTRQEPSLAWIITAQLITWLLWLALTPLIFGIARGARQRARGGVTAGLVVTQIAASIAVALLHGSINAYIRWALGLSASGQLAVVLRSLIISTFAANFLRYWLIAAAYHAVAYQREVREREVSAARLEGSLSRARLEALETRLHPHFLFNALNTIASLVRDDPRAAEAMIAHLSELLRAALAAAPGKEVTLQHELDLLDRYIAIQRARFADRLTVTVRADADTRAAYVPHLILQPLVENAISHGIAPRESAGTLLVSAQHLDGRLHLLVQDDGVGFGRAHTSHQGNGIGLASTRARLEQLYGAHFTMEISDASPTGTVVTLDLPFRVTQDAG
jgi:sensor histidine kinase YesM